MKLSKNRKINTANNDYSKTVKTILCHMHFNMFRQHQMWINKHSEILGSCYWRSNIATNINQLPIFVAVVIVTVISDTGYLRHSPIRLSRKRKKKDSRPAKKFSTGKYVPDRWKKFSTGQNTSRHTRTNREININFQRVDLHHAWWILDEEILAKEIPREPERLVS